MEDVVVYFITGHQLGPINVPDSWCEECDLTVRKVEAVLSQVDPDSVLTFAAKPWLRNAIAALGKKGWHPPVVLIDGEVFTQGIVPDREELRAALTGALIRRTSAPQC
ncbi:MAG: hypothetical protein AB7T32_17890 [Dehalococcoidia bacterium]